MRQETKKAVHLMCDKVNLMNKLKGHCQAVSGSKLVLCKIVIQCMKTCPLKMLDFYENFKGFIKAALTVKSHHLRSNVRTLELCMLVLLVGNGYVQLNSQICACFCFKTENKILSLLQIKVLNKIKKFLYLWAEFLHSFGLYILPRLSSEGVQ